MSGYWVRSNAFSSSSNCSAVNVVLLRRCLRFNGIPGSESQSEPSEVLPVQQIIMFSTKMTICQFQNIKKKSFNLCARVILYFQRRKERILCHTRFLSQISCITDIGNRVDCKFKFLRCFQRHSHYFKKSK